MLHVIVVTIRVIILIFSGYTQVALENGAPSTVGDIQTVKRPKLHRRDRLLWAPSAERVTPPSPALPSSVKPIVTPCSLDQAGTLTFRRAFFVYSE